jgi:hypothetical protein
VPAIGFRSAGVPPALFRCKSLLQNPASQILAAVRSFSWGILYLQEFGGAGGVRTRDLIDAIDARSQLRYGPTGEKGVN